MLTLKKNFYEKFKKWYKFSQNVHNAHDPLIRVKTSSREGIYDLNRFVALKMFMSRHEL